MGVESNVPPLNHSSSVVWATLNHRREGEYRTMESGTKRTGWKETKDAR